MKKPFRTFDELELPAGEEVLWQGRPLARGLAIRVFHMRMVLGYFGLLFAAGVIMRVVERQTWLEALTAASRLILPFAFVMVLLGGLAWLYSRTTRYTITNRRILIQFGAVLPMTLNVPFRQVGSAGVKVWGDGTGDLPLSVVSDERLAFLLLWPHVRPWRLRQVEPMLRSVPEPQRVAEILSGALAAASTLAPEPAGAVMPVPQMASPLRVIATAA